MLRNLDIRFISFFKEISEPLARFSIFVIFFWFGILKVLGLSPAGSMVKDLLDHTIPFMNTLMMPDTFVVLFGVLEMVIGILFLIKGLERIAIPILFFHMFATVLPLIFLSTLTWTSFMVPTLEGQYIIKNLVVVAVAIGIAAHLHPIGKKYVL
ncbi:MAG: hypothetical protein PHF79_01460 [Candidatus Pacebacteria bacterium]|nr:hypothetical protein [Candidatus Paceibacterota bacterium]